MRSHWIIIFLTLGLSARCSPSPAPDAEVESWFKENKAVFIQLKSLGEKHPRLHRIDPALSKYPDHHAELDADDKKAEQEITELLEVIDADFVVYWRKGSTDSGELISISIPYYRWGLCLGGYYQSVEYVPNEQTLERLTSPTRTYKKLNDEGWFIHASDTR